MTISSNQFGAGSGVDVVGWRSCWRGGWERVRLSRSGDVGGVVSLRDSLVSSSSAVAP